MKYILAILLLSSCSAQWHLKQAICKEPNILTDQVVRIDTFTVVDTFVYTQVDTLAMFDTIVVDTGSISVQIIREKDIIRTTIKQKPDTVFITVEKEFPPRLIYKEADHWFKWWYLLIIFAIFAIIIKLK